MFACKAGVGTNALAYYEKTKLTAVKSFITLALMNFTVVATEHLIESHFGKKVLQ
jgi:hypothetical protein